jgi:hypothetical protein
MPGVGLESTIPGLEQAKTFGALDCMATVLGISYSFKSIFYELSCYLLLNVQLLVGIAKLTSYVVPGEYTST